MNPPNPPADPHAAAWINAVYAAGGTVDRAHRTAVGALIIGLKAANIWSGLDNLLLFAQQNEFGALIDLVACKTATNVGGTTFTPNRGFTGNGSSMYINTNYNLVSDAVNFSLNSSHHSIWMLSATEASGVNVNFDGVYDGVTLTDMITDVSPGVIGRVNSPSEDIPGNGTDGYRGHWLANRSSTSAGQLYFNGASVGSNNALSAGGVPNLKMYVFCRNNVGNPALFTVGPIAAFSAGRSFTAGEAATFSNLLLVYMQSVGIP